MRMANRVLSQLEIDNVFKKLREGRSEDDPSKTAQVYDFRRPDRIMVNGCLKYRGEIVVTGRKRAFRVRQTATEP